MSLRNPTFIAIAVIAATVPGLSALAEDTGTRVSIRLADGKGALPQTQKVVEALEALGGDHLVRATVQKGEGQEELTLELWGNWVPDPQIPQTLREGFPGLSAAEIQVSSLDTPSRPKLDAADPDGTAGKKTIIKKRVRQQ